LEGNGCLYKAVVAKQTWKGSKTKSAKETEHKRGHVSAAQKSQILTFAARTVSVLAINRSLGLVPMGKELSAE